MKKLELSTFLEVTVALTVAFSLAFFLHDSGAGVMQMVRTAGEVLVVPMVLAAFISYILEPWVDAYERRGISRRSGVLLIFGIIAAASLSIAALLFPYLRAQVLTLHAETPRYIERAREFVNTFEAFLNHSFGGLGRFNFAASWMNLSMQQGFNTFDFAARVAAAVLVLAILVPLFSYTMLHDGQTLKRLLVRYIPNRYFVPTLIVFDRVHRNLGSYIRGVFAEASIIGLIATTGFFIVGVPYFWFFGILAGVLNLIPLFGPLTSMVITCVFMLLEHGTWGAGVSVLAVLLFGQIVDHFVLMPLLLFKSASLHFITGFVAILIGGKVFGVVGMLLAVPLVSVGKLVIQEISRNVRGKIAESRSAAPR